jgi:hypothetical protein
LGGIDSWFKNIFTSGHFELFLFKVLKVMYSPAIRIRVNPNPCVWGRI